MAATVVDQHAALADARQRAVAAVLDVPRPVPRTVATLLPPRVRKLPLLSRPHSRRGGLRFFLLVAAARARGLRGSR